MATLALTEILAALSLATGLGSGFAPEKGLRTCVNPWNYSSSR